MYTYAGSILMNDALAKDTVQEVWMDFWQRREAVEVQNVKSYLFRAIRYKCYNTLRDLKFNNAQIDAANSVGVSSEIELNEDVIDLSHRINRALDDLPKRCREIFTMSRINQVSNKEIAELLNISQRSVENQITFALRKLRRDLSTVKSLFF
ncbi:DNA-directed RNA polymerase sigma-70 factor [Muricauda sp. NBRC 101325]|nr:DNA-directed RNA polymerase sigma-70 factor [Muricauda sp. NBRC 101325]